MRRTTRYASTVKRGESPFIVCTSDTGILDVAYELRRCPRSWKIESGKAVMRTSFDGLLRPFFSAGM